MREEGGEARAVEAEGEAAAPSCSRGATRLGGGGGGGGGGGAPLNM